MRWWWQKDMREAQTVTDPSVMPWPVAHSHGLPDRRKSTPDQREAWQVQHDFEARLQWLEAQVLVLLERDRET